MSDSQANREGLVSVADARKAEPEIREPDALAIREMENAHQQATQKNEQGKIGSWLGSKSEKPGNIAFIVIIICFALIAACFCRFDVDKNFDSFMKVVSVLTTIITGALGYLFGSANKG